MKEMYVVVGKDQYGDDFVFNCPDSGETIWPKVVAETYVEAYTIEFPEVTYRIAKLSFLD